LPSMSAEDNIVLPLSIAGRKPDPAWFNKVVESIGLESRLSHRPSELSGGQQQRVAAARALMSRPAIVFADEPTGNLDSKSSMELLTFLQKSVQEMGQTIVMVTHDPKAAGYAQRVVFLADGQIVDQMEDPTADLVLERMKHLEV
ncbi:MAG: ATP-binding cassette domain-containing protein, partial [Actinobacteria bacterium]|nr:ATP-binding cassette domain-containing protein [Actinomycetota bacterium]